MTTTIRRDVKERFQRVYARAIERADRELAEHLDRLRPARAGAKHGPGIALRRRGAAWRNDPDPDAA